MKNFSQLTLIVSADDTTASKKICQIITRDKCSLKMHLQCVYQNQNISIIDSEKNFKVSDFNEMKNALRFVEADLKFFLIKDVEKLTGVTANSLLKNLEEPPANTFFILTTKNESKILKTILSRVTSKIIAEDIVSGLVATAPLVDFFCKNYSINDKEALSELIKSSELSENEVKFILNEILKGLMKSCNHEANQIKIEAVSRAISFVTNASFGNLFKKLFMDTLA